ncbi:MAG: hypothetical protein JWO60_1582 [Frankiales bacterium]|nr:hypothetical protein [Frankiales bacterium]
MPSGTWRLSDHDGPYAVEQFRCAAGPAGWRGVVSRADLDGRPLLSLDLAVDAAWRQVRLVCSGPAELRGGVVGGEVLWQRDGTDHRAAAAGFTGDSPLFALVTARRLGLAAGTSARLPLVRLSAALGALTVEEGWARTADVREADLVIERYEVADLATGARRTLHLVDDVVVDATGVELLALDLGGATLPRP